MARPQPPLEERGGLGRARATRDLVPEMLEVEKPRLVCEALGEEQPGKRARRTRRAAERRVMENLGAGVPCAGARMPLDRRMWRGLDRMPSPMEQNRHDRVS